MQVTIVQITAIKQLVLVPVQLEQFQLEVLERFQQPVQLLELELEQLRHNRLSHSCCRMSCSRFQQRHMIHMSHSLKLEHSLCGMSHSLELEHSMCGKKRASRALACSVCGSVLACSNCDGLLQQRCWSASWLPTRTKYPNVA